jgi:hypothetical protein
MRSSKSATGRQRPVVLMPFKNVRVVIWRIVRSLIRVPAVDPEFTITTEASSAPARGAYEYVGVLEWGRVGRRALAHGVTLSDVGLLLSGWWRVLRLRWCPVRRRRVLRRRVRRRPKRFEESDPDVHDADRQSLGCARKSD